MYTLTVRGNNIDFLVPVQCSPRKTSGTRGVFHLEIWSIFADPVVALSSPQRDSCHATKTAWKGSKITSQIPRCWPSFQTPQIPNPIKHPKTTLLPINPKGTAAISLVSETTGVPVSAPLGQFFFYNIRRTYTRFAHALELLCVSRVAVEVYSCTAVSPLNHFWD